MARQYDDFEMVIQASGESYSVQLLNSPAGQANCDFKLPFTGAELSNFYTRIGQVHRSTRRAGTPDSEAARKFGDKLFHSVFNGEMLGQLRSSMDRSHAQGRGLRIRLRLKGVPELAELPWEFLYDSEQDHFLATSTTTPLVRFLDLPQCVMPLKVRPPVRVLVVIAGPRNLARLDAEGEWNRLCSSLAALESRGMIVLERLPEATMDALRRRARGEPFHILHFIGHGDFDESAGDGVLEFEDAKGMSDPVSGRFLGGILRDHDTLRLAVLNACEGARQSNRDPFSGVAQSLCQQRLPAVVAMQFEISDEAAKTFAEEFYSAISDGLPVDASLSEARKALFTARYGQEWATPVLYMRSPSGLLFDVQRRPKPVPARPEDQPNRIEAEREGMRAEADRLYREEERLKADPDAKQREYENAKRQAYLPQPSNIRPEPQSPRPESVAVESEPILLNTKMEEQGKSDAASRFSIKKLHVGLAAAALLIGLATFAGMKYSGGSRTAQSGSAPSSQASKVEPPSQIDYAHNQLEQVEAAKKKAQAAADDAVRRQQQAEADAARSRAEEERSKKARADAAEQQRRQEEEARLKQEEAVNKARAEEEAARKAREETEAVRLKAEEERQQQQLALQKQRDEDEKERRRIEAAKNPNWVFSVDGKTYKVKVGNGFLTISPNTGSLFAQLPIKNNNKGQTEIMGQWQSGTLSGFLLIQGLNEGMIRGYMLVPQLQGANCTTRTAAYLGNMSNNMNHQVQGCRQVNVSWSRQ